MKEGFDSFHLNLKELLNDSGKKKGHLKLHLQVVERDGHLHTLGVMGNFLKRGKPRLH